MTDASRKNDMRSRTVADSLTVYKSLNTHHKLLQVVYLPSFIDVIK